MSDFGEIFRDLRRRRRIPMRLFQEGAGVSTSHIHDIERKGVIPTLARTKAIGSVFREVAVEQGAADPDSDVRRLLAARQRAVLSGELETPPVLTQILLLLTEALGGEDVGEEYIAPIKALGELDENQRPAIAEPMARAIELFALLDQQERSAMARRIGAVAAIVESLEGDEARERVLLEILDRFDSILADAKAQVPGAGAKAAKAGDPPETDEPAPARSVSTASA